MTIKEAYQSLKKGLDSKIEDKLKQLQALTSDDGIKTYGSYASELSTLDGKYPGTGGIRTFITGRDKLTYDFIDLDKYYISDEVDQLLSNYYDKEEVDKILEDYCTKDEAEQMNEQIKQDLEAEIINEHNLSVEADENLGKDISQVRSDLSAESDSREEADKKLEELVTEVQGKIIDEHNLSVEADDALRVLIEALQDKLIYFDDHFVCKANDSEGYLNWDKDTGIYFNDANAGDMWKLVAGEDSVPLCFAVTVDGITYQYCVDMKTGNAYYRYSEFGEEALINVPWIPVVNTDTNLFIFTDSLPTENIEENKIYCVSDPDSDETNNLFDEYYYHDGKWELFGKYTLKVSFDDYYTKEETYSKEEVLTNFQQKLTAGTGITIEDNVISATVTGGITSVLASGTSPLSLDASTTDGIVHITGSVDTSNFATTSDLTGKQDALKYYSENTVGNLSPYPSAQIDCVGGSNQTLFQMLADPTNSSDTYLLATVSSRSSSKTIKLDSTGFYYDDCEVATKCTLEDYYTKTEADEKFQEKLSTYTEDGHSATISANGIYMDTGTEGISLVHGDIKLFIGGNNEDDAGVYYNDCEVATQCWVNDAIANIQAGDVDLSGYQKKLEWYEEGENFAQIAVRYGGKTSAIDVESSSFGVTSISLYSENGGISCYAPAGLTYNGCEVATQCWVEDNYYTQTEIDNKLATIEGGGSVAPCTWIGVGSATISGASGSSISRNELFPQSGTPQSGDAILYFHSYQDDPETIALAVVSRVSDDVVSYQFLYGFQISGGSTDLSNYYTKTEINNLIGDYYTKDETSSLLEKYQLKLDWYHEDISYGTLNLFGGIIAASTYGNDDTFCVVALDGNVLLTYSESDVYWTTEILHGEAQTVRLKASLEGKTPSTTVSILPDFIQCTVVAEDSSNEVVIDRNHLWLKGKKVATQDYVDEAVSSVSGGTTSIDIIDNLTSDRTNAALSANMGRELAEMIDELEEGKQNNLIYYSESAHNGVVIGAENTNVEVTASPFTYNGVEVATVDDLSDLKSKLEAEISTAIGGGIVGIDASGDDILTLTGTVDNGTAIIRGSVDLSDYAKESDLSNFVTFDFLSSTLSSGYVTLSSLSTTLLDYVKSSALSDYVTSSDLSSVLADYAKTSDIPKVIDNLESDSTANALSANMGRVLEEEISAKLDELQHYFEESSDVTITANHVNIDTDELLYNDVEVATVTDLDELKNLLEGEITTAAGGGVTVVNASGTSPLVLDATVEDGTATITGFILSGYYATQSYVEQIESSLSNYITSSTISNYLGSYLLSSVAQETYQEKLTAGNYISITDDNVINTTYVAGSGIRIGSSADPTIELKISTEGDNYISLANSTDSGGTQIISASLTESFLNVINGKQDSLTAGSNISINDNVISAVLDGYVTSGSLTDTLKDYVTTEQLNDAIAGITPGEGDTEVNKVVAVNADTTGVLSFSGTPQIGEVTITASINESGLIEFINNNIESISIEEIDNLF